MAVNRLASPYSSAVRIAMFVLCTAAVGWAFYVLPFDWGQSGIERVAQHILYGEPFKTGAMDALTPARAAVRDDKWDRPSVFRSLAVIRLRILEEAISSSDQSSIDRLMGRLYFAVLTSLRNSPAAPFEWSVLFWLMNTRNGLSAGHLKYLAMSYATGQNEGWVALKRNRLALAVFSRLSPTLQGDAVKEFARLVSSDFISEAADILVGPGWQIRDRLLGALKNVDIIHRQNFARSIYKLGYDASVPGVDPMEFRPWQR